MQLKKSFAAAVAVGALAVGGVAVAQPAIAAENSGTAPHQEQELTSVRSGPNWRYAGSFARQDQCDFAGRALKQLKGWRGYTCQPAGDSWDLLYHH